MQQAADRLEQIIADTERECGQWTDEETSRHAAPDKWSRKELLAHLIDSAANNHQRFVRMQAAKHLALPGYEQDFWIERTAPDARPWASLLELWGAYNRHLAHIIRRVRLETLEHTMAIDGKPPVTLAFLIADYIDHMEHHLSQMGEA